MASPDSKISFLVNGGVDEQTTDELFGAIVQQGSSPPLADSRNTRLSIIKGSCARAPEFAQTALSMGAGRPVYGIVGDGVQGRSAVYTTADFGSCVVARDGLTTSGTNRIKDTGIGGWQNGYLPIQMVRAGAVPGAQASSAVAVCHNETLDQMWFAWTSADNDDVTKNRIYACCFSGDGTLLAPPTAMPINLGFGGPQPADFQTKVGLTQHGSNGVALWFGLKDTFGYAVSVKKLSVNDGVSATPTGSGSVVAGGQAVDWDVCPVDNFNAILAASAAGAANNGRAHLVAVNTGTLVDSYTVTSATNGISCWAACHSEVINGQRRHAIVWSSDSSATVTYALLDSNLDPVWATVVRSMVGKPVGRLAVKFLVAPLQSQSAMIIAHEASDSSVSWGDQTPTSDTLPHFVELWNVQLSNGTLTELQPLLYSNLQNRGGQWTRGTEMYPVFCVARSYARGDKALPGGDGYTDDPSVDAYLVSPSGATDPWPAQRTCIARFGVVRGNMAPAITVAIPWMVSGPAGFANGLMTFAYLKGLAGDLAGFGRFVQLKMTPEQPAVAVDKDGAAFVAAALPAQWDGNETVEAGGPLHAPKLAVVLDATGGIIAPAGAYSLVAIYSWTDAAGLTHRSRPSNIVTVTADGVADKIGAVISLPDTMRNDAQQMPVDVLLYTTDTNGASYHLVDVFPFTVFDNGMAIKDGIGRVTVDGPVYVNTGNPQIFSTGSAGEELTPQPPPPLRDIAIVGSRVWGVDAEIPSRLVFSKLRVAGIGFEFNPALEVILPAGAGDVLAIREMAGTLVAFAERGVYQVADGGPNNAGQGGSFGPPYKLSDVGCASRHAVISTPVGILFLNETGRFCAVSGGQVVQVPGVQVDLESQSVTGCFLLDEGDEAVFVVGNKAKVYNYALQRWTTWDLPNAPDMVVGSSIDRGVANVYNATEGRLRRVQSRSRSATTNMSWETDWILLAGDFQDHVLLRSVLFTGRVITSAGVTISVYTNYDPTPTTSLSWTAAEVSDSVEAGTRFTLKLEPRRQDTRAVKIAITENASAADDRVGLVPISVTIVHAVEAMLHEECIKPASYKG